MTLFELSRYLDYCSEALSLTGKVAALYVQRFDDPVALQAVNEVEELTTRPLAQDLAEADGALRHAAGRSAARAAACRRRQLRAAACGCAASAPGTA